MLNQIQPYIHEPTSIHPESYDLERYRNLYPKTTDLIDDFIDSYYLSRKAKDLLDVHGGSTYHQLDDEERNKLASTLIEETPLNDLPDLFTSESVHAGLQEFVGSTSANADLLRITLVKQVYSYYQKVIDEIFELCDEKYNPQN